MKGMLEEDVARLPLCSVTMTKAQRFGITGFQETTNMTSPKNSSIRPRLPATPPRQILNHSHVNVGVFVDYAVLSCFLSYFEFFAFI